MAAEKHPPLLGRTGRQQSVKVFKEETHQSISLDSDTTQALSFFIGVCNLAFTVYMLGAFPEYFGFYYLPKCTFLLIFRYFHWKPRKLQYFLLDFCYLANLAYIVFLCLGYADLMSQSTRYIFFRMMFAFSIGPLGFAIGMFRNALVFHSAEKITSLMIHVEPLALSWCLRWFDDNALIDVGSSATFMELFLYPMAAYLVCWNIPYGLWLVLYGHSLDESGHVTLYHYTCKTNPVVRRATERLGRRWGPLGYMGLHAVFAAATILLGLLWWHVFWAHTAFGVMLFMISIWNGSTFYVGKVFITPRATAKKPINVGSINNT